MLCTRLLWAFIDVIGAKLLLIANLLDRGTVTGVDISKQRLFTCKSLLRKYKVDNSRLFCGNGCEFDVLAPFTEFGKPRDKFEVSEALNLELKDSKKPFYAPRRLRVGIQSSKCLQYDKVLVDAECMSIY